MLLIIVCKYVNNQYVKKSLFGGGDQEMLVVTLLF